MQTFLPYPNFYKSAQALDRQRLGKQRVEVLQILNALRGLSTGWVNHPATKMWRGHERSLAIYGTLVCEEWRRRGYVDGILDKLFDCVLVLPDTGKPSWVGDEAFHRSHQSNLVRKMPEHYGSQFPDVPDDLPYVWPVP